MYDYENQYVHTLSIKRNNIYINTITFIILNHINNLLTI